MPASEARNIVAISTIALAILATSDESVTAFTAITPPYLAPMRLRASSLANKLTTQNTLSVTRKKSSRKRILSGLCKELYRSLGFAARPDQHGFAEGFDHRHQLQLCRLYSGLSSFGQSANLPGR